MTESNELMVLVQESDLPKEKAQTLLDQFSGYFEMAAEWSQLAKEIQVTNAEQIELMQKARDGRLFLRQKRIAVENTRKQLKEQALREGKAIDGIANVLKALIVPIEEHLERQEYFVKYKHEAEEAARREEAERLLKEKEEREAREREANLREIEAENERRRIENEKLEKKLAAERAARKRAQEKAEAEARRIREEEERKRREEQAAIRAEYEAEKRRIEEANRAKYEAEKREREAKEAEERRVREALAKKEKEEREQQALEMMRLAHTVKCPHCGKSFCTDDLES